MERRILTIILTIILLFSALLIHAQDKTDFVKSDSLNYSYYLKGEWDSVIHQGQRLISKGIDYKFLRQRLGYAFFMKEDYTAARLNFKKALQSDSYDAFTNEYLFYSFVNTGREEHAGWLESRMDPQLAGKIGIKGFKPVEEIDAELNYKASGSTLRSGVFYYRIGVGTRLGSRLRLYQSYSKYSQDITLLSSLKFAVRQPEYYTRVGWNITKFTILTGAYHHVHVSGKGNKVYDGYLFLAGISPDLNRFIFETDASLFRYAGENIWQADIHAGYIFPGRSAFYLKGTGALIKSSETGIVSGLAAGSRLSRRTWLDMNFLTGGMDLYNDFRGMYVYNSYDPVILRSGATLSHYAGSRIVLWFNFTLERKKYNEDFAFRYNQYSYLGGIRLKL